MATKEKLKQIFYDAGFVTPKINPSKMTNDEIAQLRFTTLSSEEEMLVEKELIKRGLLKN